MELRWRIKHIILFEITATSNSIYYTKRVHKQMTRYTQNLRKLILQTWTTSHSIIYVKHSLMISEGTINPYMCHARTYPIGLAVGRLAFEMCMPCACKWCLSGATSICPFHLNLEPCRAIHSHFTSHIACIFCQAIAYILSHCVVVRFPALIVRCAHRVSLLSSQTTTTSI